MKKRVSSEKIAAWMKPTKTSNAMKGTGKKYGTKYAMTSIKTSPAKMFPKRRKENEMRRAISEKNSMIPTTKPINDLKLKNLPAYLNAPMVRIPVISITRNEIMASARGKL